MKSFVYVGTNTVVANGNFTKDSITPTTFGFVATPDIKTGVVKVTDGADMVTNGVMYGNLIVGTQSGINHVTPIHRNGFRFVKGEYVKATTFEAKVTIPTPAQVGDYTVIVAAKGKQFNERNKWTASTHVYKMPATADTVGKDLMKQINLQDNGVTATYASGVLTVKGNTAGEPFKLITADELTGATVVVTTEALPAYGDAAYVVDLYKRCAATDGIEYTYQEAGELLYKNYDFNPLAQPNATDTGYTIFTLSFGEPRHAGKTTDEVVNQTVHVVFKTGAAGIASFEALCKNLAKKV